MKDCEIVDLYWSRSETAITASAEKYGSYCHTVSYNILHSNEDAEECVNDTWLRAWNAMPPRRPAQLATFLGKITRNISLDRFKRYSAEKRGRGQTELVLSELEDCIPDSAGVEQVVDEIALTEAINAFLYAQPEQKRNIFVRRYWYLCPIKDIGAVYGMSETKTASLLFRMRNELKKHLEKESIDL